MDFLKEKDYIFNFNAKLMWAFPWVMGHGGSELFKKARAKKK
jgi:hypothetical protein